MGFLNDIVRDARPRAFMRPAPGPLPEAGALPAESMAIESAPQEVVQRAAQPAPAMARPAARPVTPSPAESIPARADTPPQPPATAQRASPPAGGSSPLDAGPANDLAAEPVVHVPLPPVTGLSRSPMVEAVAGQPMAEPEASARLEAVQPAAQHRQAPLSRAGGNQTVEPAGEQAVFGNRTLAEHGRRPASFPAYGSEPEPPVQEAAAQVPSIDSPQQPVSEPPVPATELVRPADAPSRRLAPIPPLAAQAQRERAVPRERSEPRVHIGRIEITVLAPEPARPAQGGAGEASDLASRLYLRRL